MKVTKCFNPRLNQYGYYMTDANGNIKALTYEDGLKQGMVMLGQIRAEIEKSSHGKWYVGRVDGKTEEVLLLDEVLDIFDKAIKGQTGG